VKVNFTDKEIVDKQQNADQEGILDVTRAPPESRLSASSIVQGSCLRVQLSKPPVRRFELWLLDSAKLGCGQVVRIGLVCLIRPPTSVHAALKCTLLAACDCRFAEAE
jgi:hypothetical protein